MTDNQRYTYRVTWSEEDKEHVGLCAEFPSLSCLEETPAKAFAGIMALVLEVLEDMLDSGEAAPEPLAKRSYSGRFQVRIPPEQHRALALKAAEEGTSLNRYVSMKLSA